MTDPRCIDLHTHSHCSDGLLSPAGLVAAARTNGLAAMALTDHDTTAGLAEALAAGQELGVEVVEGVEVSAFCQEVPVHILGYGVDPGSAALQGCLAELQAIRRRRNRRICERLAAKGIDISEEELATTPGLVGRPHFARILAKRGVVADEEEAFRRFLRRNAAAYVPKEPFAAERAIAAIRAAGGVAVLAHPHTYPLSPTRLEGMVRELAAAGLGGLELRYPGMPPAFSRRLERLAAAFSLVATGGSDYHGGRNHHPLAACRPGGFTVGYHYLAGLKHRLGRP